MSAGFFPLETDDIELFDAAMTARLKRATSEEIREACVTAARYLEDEAERRGSRMGPVNNATATLCGSVVELIRRLEQK